MKNLQKLEAGCGVSFSIIGENGNLKKFMLAVVEEYSEFTERTKKGLTFIYIDPETGAIARCDGPYSGGTTGMGKNICDLFSFGNLKIITTDLKEITKMCEEASEETRKQQDAYNEKMRKAAEDINQLPEITFIHTTSGGIQYCIRRAYPATFNPSRNREAEGGHYQVERKEFNFDFKSYYVDQYWNKGGAFQMKKLALECRYLLGIAEDITDSQLHEAKELVKNLRYQMQTANKTVNDIKRNARYSN